MTAQTPRTGASLNNLNIARNYTDAAYCYSDGEPIIQTYTRIFNDYETLLESDGIHLTVNEGQPLYRDEVAYKLGGIVLADIKQDQTPIATSASYSFINNEAENYNNALTGTLNDTQKEELDDLVSALKAASIWTKIQQLQLYNIPTNSNDALLNLKNAMSVGSVVNSPTWTTGHGFTFDGATNYIDSGYAPSLNANWSTTGIFNSHMGVWVSQLNNTTNGVFTGVYNQTIRRLQIKRQNNGQPFRSSMSANNEVDGTTLSENATGLLLASRNGDNTSLYRNGVLEGSGTQSPNSPNDGNLFVGARSNAGTPTDFTACQIGIFIVGFGLNITEVGNLHTALNSWMTARASD